MGLAPLRGGGREGVPMPREAHSLQGDQQGWGETLRGSEDWKGAQLAFPLLTWAPGSLLGSRAWSSTLWGPLWLCGGVGGWGRKSRGKRGGILGGMRIGGERS